MLPKRTKERARERDCEMRNMLSSFSSLLSSSLSLPLPVPLSMLLSLPLSSSHKHEAFKLASPLKMPFYVRCNNRRWNFNKFHQMIL